MKLSYIALHIGDHEAMLLCRLLKRHIKELETEAFDGVGLNFDLYQEADYDMATDMHNFLIKMIDSSHENTK